MNVKKLISVRDSKTEVFSPPVMCQNLAEAERIFSDFLSDNRHKEDYVCYCVGEFDVLTGQLNPVVPFVVTLGE